MIRFLALQVVSQDQYIASRTGRKQTKDVKAKPKKFYTLNFRVVRFAISEDSYESIITNLPKEDFPVEEIKKVYAMRWHRNIVQGIEICYRIMLLSFKKGGVYH